MTLAEEVHLLKEKGFVNGGLEVEQIRTDLHRDPCWVDAFWRRRHQHENRTDPEIEYFQRHGPNYSKVLEIGSAYGRVTRKLASLDDIGSVTGIEIAEGFSRYIPTTTGTKLKFVFDDFFQTTQLDPEGFDLVVLPMNTLPSFPIELLPQLFEQVATVLEPEGQFVFSTYPESTSPRGERHFTELLTDPDDLKQVPLAIEFFTLPERQTAWGVESVTFSKYTYLGERYPTQTRHFRTTRSFMNHSELNKIIESNGFTIVDWTRVEHSYVATTTKLS